MHIANFHAKILHFFLNFFICLSLEFLHIANFIAKILHCSEIFFVWFSFGILPFANFIAKILHYLVSFLFCFYEKNIWNLQILLQKICTTTKSLGLSHLRLLYSKFIQSHLVFTLAPSPFPPSTLVRWLHVLCAGCSVEQIKFWVQS